MNGRTPTLLAGLHGTLRTHPWIEDAGGEDVPDMFGLAVDRAEAYGWSSTHLGAGAGLAGQRWAHSDAGEDWTQDGRVRQLGRLQCTVEKLRNQRLPAMTVLHDGLTRIGDVRLTGAHVPAPTHLTVDSSVPRAVAAGWFAFSDPDGRESLGGDRACRAAPGGQGLR
ncbi:hypothetical protein [Streptomyces sp. HNM0574]|uniref:hypothetical protein n=1 Tax=Streptomyces sp. HNM0574 TaxID=2714954 RepID=UPI00146CC3B8|nr:hypothetical protein [Streptomyces sp. HNM0574]NLU68910.1 hypothetical protein [Streptomyces sp. HNM0574]